MLGKQIELFRSAKGYNQSQFAAMVGISKTTLCRYESGVRKPPFYRVEKMAEVLQLSLEHFAAPGPEGLVVTVVIAPPLAPKGGAGMGPVEGTT
jgi:transcriptional regulator with XRE-family HTH domain